MNPQSTTTCTCACTPSSGAQLWAQVYHHDDSSLFDIMPPSVDVAAVKDLVKRERVIAQMESPIDPCRMFVHRMMVDHNMRFIPSDLPRPRVDDGTPFVGGGYGGPAASSSTSTPPLCQSSTSAWAQPEAGGGDDGEGAVAMEEELVEEEEDIAVVAGEAVPSSVTKEDRSKMTDAEYTRYAELCDLFWQAE